MSSKIHGMNIKTLAQCSSRKQAHLISYSFLRAFQLGFLQKHLELEKEARHTKAEQAYAQRSNSGGVPHPENSYIVTILSENKRA